MSFSFIDDKNKILDIDPSQNYYLAGKNQDVLFISKTFNISDGIITFDVDTYTEPFLNEVQKRNTEIQIELGYNTLGVQKVLLRDYAFAQPRVYIEGLNPSKVNFSEYYTIEEVDSLLANIDVNVSLDNYYTKAEVDEKISEPTDLSNYYTKDQVDNLIPEIPEIPEVPTKVSELENDSGFISGYTENDPIYTADKPNIAMKSDLFSKSYNDLTDKPEIFTPTKNGDGSKYLADDGTYKKIEGGGSGGETDLTDYHGENINLQLDTTFNVDTNESIKLYSHSSDIENNKSSFIEIYGSKNDGYGEMTIQGQAKLTLSAEGIILSGSPIRKNGYINESILSVDSSINQVYLNNVSVVHLPGNTLISDNQRK